MRRISIAHISDLHFGNHDHAASEALRIDLGKLAPDFLIVTGDLTQWGRKAEVNEAKQFLASTLNDIRKSQPNCQCLVVPGNHDLGVLKRGYNWNSVFFEHPFNPASSGLPATLSEYYKKHRRVDDSTADTAESLAQKALAVCEYYPEKNVAFLKLNSNIVSWWPLNYGRGKVGKEQLTQLMIILNDYRSAFADFEYSRRIALVHHHVQHLPNAESDQYLLMDDAGEVWHQLLEHGSELILHGHKHYATNMCLRFFRGQEEREMMIVSAGSATSRDQPKEQTRSYFHITCDPAQYSLQKRELSGAYFGPVSYPPLHFSRIRSIPSPPDDFVIDHDTLKTMLVPSTEDLDTVHRITRFSCKVMIDSARNYVADYTFEGYCVDNYTDNVFIIPIVAQGVSNPDMLNLKVSNSAGFQPVAPYAVVAGRYKFRFTVPTEPFRNGANGFTIRASFTLPGIMLSERDYDVVGFTRFVHGIEKFEYRLTTEKPINGALCYSIRKLGLQKLSVFQVASDAGHYELPFETVNASEIEFGFMMCYENLIMN